MRLFYFAICGLFSLSQVMSAQSIDVELRLKGELEFLRANGSVGTWIDFPAPISNVVQRGDPFEIVVTFNTQPDVEFRPEPDVAQFRNVKSAIGVFGSTTLFFKPQDRKSWGLMSLNNGTARGGGDAIDMVLTRDISGGIPGGVFRPDGVLIDFYDPMGNAMSNVEPPILRFPHIQDFVSRTIQLFYSAEEDHELSNEEQKSLARSIALVGRIDAVSLSIKPAI